MPNTPATVGALLPFPQVLIPESHQNTAQKLFSAVEKSSVPETLMDAVTGLSGPAYVAIMVEALSGGVAAVT